MLGYRDVCTADRDPIKLSAQHATYGFAQESATLACRADHHARQGRKLQGCDARPARRRASRSGPGNGRVAQISRRTTSAGRQELRTHRARPCCGARLASPPARSIMRFLFSLRISDRIRTGVLAKVIRDARAQNELRLARPPTLITFPVPAPAVWLLVQQSSSDARRPILRRFSVGGRHRQRHHLL